MTDSMNEFMARVVDATEDAPYSVTRTPEGFELRTDIGSQRWLDRLQENGVTQAHLHRVAVEGFTYAITTDSRELAWGAGVPVLATPKDVRKSGRGRKGPKNFGGPAPDAPGSEDPFSPDAGRRIITSVGEALGLTHRQTGRRLEIALTAVAIVATVALSFAVAAWVLFLR